MESFLKGSIVGNYRLISLIGQGGMGQVYKARHIHLDTIAAIKLLVKSPDTDIIVVSNFLREARTAAQIRHENVVEVYDVGEASNYWYLIMEYVPGIDCAKLIRTHNKIPVHDAFKIIKDAAKGLLAIHEKDLVHRDIKPHNLYITKDLVVKVGDFGLVRYQETIQDLSNKIAGTPAYMAPEQAMDVKKINVTTDIYSLGTTFYHLITGKQPYQGKSSHEILFSLFKGDDFPRPRESVPEISKKLDQIIMKMVAKEQEKRYRNMAEVLEALEEFEAYKWPEGFDEKTYVTFLTESAIQDMRDSQTRQITEISPPQPNPAQEIQDLTLGASELSAEITCDGVANEGLVAELGPEITVDERVGQMSVEATYDESASFPVIESTNIMKIFRPENESIYNDDDDYYPTGTLERLPKKQAIPTMIREKVSHDGRPLEKKFKIALVLAICCISLGVTASLLAKFFSSKPKNYRLEMLKPVNSQGEIKPHFDLEEPIYLMFIFKWMRKDVAPLVLKIRGENLQGYEKIIKPNYKEPIQEEKLLVKWNKLEAGTYDIFVTIISENEEIQKKVSVTLKRKDVRSSFHLSLAKIVNRDGEIQETFQLGEPISLMLMFKWKQKKIAPFLLKVHGKGICEKDRIVKANLEKSTQEVKIPLQLKEAKIGDYEIFISFSSSYKEKVKFKIVKPKAELKILKSYFSDTNTVRKIAFCPGESIYLSLKWYLKSPQSLQLPLKMKWIYPKGQEENLQKELLPGIYNGRVFFKDPPTKIGKYKVKFSLKFWNREEFKEIPLKIIPKTPLVESVGISLVDIAGKMRNTFYFGEKIFVRVRWKAKSIVSSQNLKIAVSGKNIKERIKWESIESEECMFPLNLLKSKGEEYNVSVSVTTQHRFIKRTSIPFSLQKSGPRLYIYSVTLCNQKDERQNSFQIGETIYCKILWEADNIDSKTLCKLKVFDGEFLLAEKKIFNIKNAAKKENSLAFKMPGIKPGHFSLRVEILAGKIKKRKRISLMIRDTRIAYILIHPRKKRLYPGQMVKFSATAYTKDNKKVDFKPYWKAKGGSISQDGWYKAGRKPGKYRIRVYDGPGRKKRARARVYIPYPLHEIRIFSKITSLNPGQAVVFSAKGLDKRGRSKRFSPQWRATGGTLGRISKYKIRYRAGKRVGKYYIYVRDIDTKKYTTLPIEIRVTGWFGEIIPEGISKSEKFGEYIWEKDKSVMVYIPPDAYLQRGFYIDKYELSVRRFAQFVQETDYRTVAEKNEWSMSWDGRRWIRTSASWKTLRRWTSYPVVHLAQKDIIKYANWSGKQLPTQIQWLKAAGRSAMIPYQGTKLMRLRTNPESDRIYPWGNDLPGTYRCNYAINWRDRKEDGYEFLAPINSYPKGASPFGCINMSGNVCEWTSDGYILGGAWCYPASGCKLTIANGFKNSCLVNGNNCVGARFMVYQ